MNKAEIMTLADGYAIAVAQAPHSPRPLAKKLAEQRIEKARSALETALEQQAEPVGFMYPDDYSRMLRTKNYSTVYPVAAGNAAFGHSTIKLYTTPPQQQAEPVCWCRKCNENRLVNNIPFSMTRMILCPTCGNKRCPRASDHRLDCTGSNETGQPGSVYPALPQQRAEPVYKDSTPHLHVGDSAFESWFQAQLFATQTGIKQISRDSYAAGMGDPLVVAAPQQQAEPGANYSDIVSDGGRDPRNKFDAAQPQRKPLTIDEVEQIIAQHSYELHGDRARYIVRMTEEAHGIKEGI